MTHNPTCQHGGFAPECSKCANGEPPGLPFIPPLEKNDAPEETAEERPVSQPTHDPFGRPYDGSTLLTMGLALLMFIGLFGACEPVATSTEAVPAAFDDNGWAGQVAPPIGDVMVKQSSLVVSGPDIPIRYADSHTFTFKDGNTYHAAVGAAKLPPGTSTIYVAHYLAPDLANQAHFTLYWFDYTHGYQWLNADGSVFNPDSLTIEGVVPLTSNATIHLNCPDDTCSSPVFGQQGSYVFSGDGNGDHRSGIGVIDASTGEVWAFVLKTANTNMGTSCGGMGSGHVACGGPGTVGTNLWIKTNFVFKGD